MNKYQVVIGRNEPLDLTGYAQGVPAKIDTGAFRSAIHCSSIKKIERDGMVQLEVELLGHPCSPEVYPMVFTEFDTVHITNSFGHEEDRYEIKLKIKLGPKVFTSSFTLADRSKNLFPILVGRMGIKNRFIVDVARGGVDRMKLRKSFNITHPIQEEDLEDSL